MPKIKENRRKQRHRRVKGRVSGTPQRPRLFVFKSNKHIYCGLVDDVEGHVLISYSDTNVGKNAKNTQETAKKVGEGLAEAAIKKGYKRVVFDRSGYKYHGKVKALAEGARSKGLVF